MTEHTRGVALTTLGVLLIVPDATIIRLISADSLTNTMFRAALTGLTLMAALGVLYRRRLVTVVRSAGRLGMVMAVFSGTTTLLFVYAVDRTSVGNAVMLLATSPLWAALWTRIFIGDPIDRRTLAAMPLAFGGVLVAVSGSIGAGGLDGDLMALAASMLMAANLTILRFQRHVDMLPVSAIGNLLAAGAALVAGAQLTLAPADRMPMLIVAVVLIPGAAWLVNRGARRIPSPEAALILLLETVLSPVFAWAVADERLAPTTAIGGMIVVGTLVWHAVANGRVTARSVPRPAR